MRRLLLLPVLMCFYTMVLSQTGESPFKQVSISSASEEFSVTTINDAEPAVAKVDAFVPPEVRTRIPRIAEKDPNKFALIIGNEDYSSYQTGLNPEVDVIFAKSDAEVFREYATDALGVPEENVIFKVNARSSEMRRMIEQIALITKSAGGDAEIYFYYAGHGFPDIQTREPYLIPVDVKGDDLDYAIKLSDLYNKLTENEARRVVAFLDACFSGGARNEGLLAARGIRVRPRQDAVTGNIVVFAAAAEEQPALPWREKGHGMFTYHLLKVLQETEADVTYGEISDYLSRQVGVRSAIVNQREQTPVTNVGLSIQEGWREIRIR